MIRTPFGAYTHLHTYAYNLYAVLLLFVAKMNTKHVRWIIDRFVLCRFMCDGIMNESYLYDMLSAFFGLLFEHSENFQVNHSPLNYIKQTRLHTLLKLLLREPLAFSKPHHIFMNTVEHQRRSAGQAVGGTIYITIYDTHIFQRNSMRRIMPHARTNIPTTARMFDRATNI